MVVETGGFSKAAKRLGVSASHISRQVARLEDRVGIKLLARSTRSVRLTDAGAAYHAKVAELAAGFDEANQAAAGANAELAGRIRISAAGALAEERVAPIVARFARENPRVSIEMDFNTRNLDLVDQGFDFAIRYGILADSGLIARKLTDRQVICAAAPEYLAIHGSPRHPAELKQHACLRSNQGHWVFRDPETKKLIKIRISGPWSANSGHALRAAAIEGLGIVYLPVENLTSSIQKGDLIRLLDAYEDTSRASWIVFPERRYMPLRVRRAIDYLEAAFRLEAKNKR